MSATPIPQPAHPCIVLPENGDSLKLGLASPPKKRGRPRKVQAEESLPPKGRGLDALFVAPAKLTTEMRAQASRIVEHLTTKRGRLPTKAELTMWATDLRAGAAALDAYVAAGLLETPSEGMDLPPPEDLGEEPDDAPPVRKKAGRPKKGSRAPRVVDESKLVCEGCNTLGHSLERCPETA